MNSEVSKTYDPKSLEGPIYQAWQAEGHFTADPAVPGEPYCIVIPPPNVTGALHLGHAINNTLQDILIRVHRMRGFNALWIPGIDHAGIATQAVVEKQLKEKENLTRQDVGRDGLVERIWAWKEQYGNRILEQLKRLGCSCDWSRARFTLDEQCARAVRETFFKLFKDGLIYRGKRLVNWDAHLQTSISDDEIYHETVKTSMWHIRYPIVGKSDEGEESTANAKVSGTGFQPVLVASENETIGTGIERPRFMIVATTRPETMLGDTAVAVHSEDPRWNWAIGQFVELPLTGRKIPIIADDILVDPKFGSGVVKVTPAHDPNDYAVWQRHQGQADEIGILNILNPDGTLNANGGPYTGMKRDASRRKVVADLTELGLLEKEEPYETQVGHSDRSKTPVEPYLSDQWFVKMAPLAEPALEVVRNGTIKFFPERHAQQYLSWLGEKRDWPISRQLWWGHRIPVWTFQWDGPHADSPSDSQEVRMDLRYLTAEQNRQLAFQVIRPGADGRIFIGISVRPGHPDIERLLEQHGGHQDPDVLDTWFSSALWPHSTLGWPDDTPDLRKWYPTSVLVTAREIVTLWVARMVMTGIYNMSDHPSYRGTGFQPVMNAPQTSNRLTEQSLNHGQDARATNKPKLAIPFYHVHIHPVIQDGNGEPMKKSLGNGVDPVDIIESHGADPLRFTLAQIASETQDVRLPVQLVCPHCATKIPNTASQKETLTCPNCGKTMTRPVSTARPTTDAPLATSTSERFDTGKHFCNKIWQVAHFFVIANLAKIAPERVDESKWTLADRWILSRFNRAVLDANTALEIYRFDQYAKICYDFFYGDFCDWYVEAAKPALRDAAIAGQTANMLAAILDGSLRLMHPVIPFITEAIWSRLNEVRQDRSLGDRLALPLSERLIKAAWPTSSVNQTDGSAESAFSTLQQVISGIRALRNDYKVEVKKTVDVLIHTPGDLSETIAANRGMIELLAICRIKSASPAVEGIAGAARTMAGGCEIFVEGVIDVDAEKQRQAKRREELTKQIATMQGRLSNQAYIAKAPPHLVEQTRKQLADAQAELGKIDE